MPFVMQIADDSMAPRITWGDIVMANDITPKSGDFVLARIGSRFVVRQLRVRNHRWRNFALVPLNDAWPTFTSESRNVNLLGRVVRVEHPLLRLNSSLTPEEVYVAAERAAIIMSEVRYGQRHRG